MESSSTIFEYPQHRQSLHIGISFYTLAHNDQFLELPKSENDAKDLYDLFSKEFKFDSALLNQTMISKQIATANHGKYLYDEILKKLELLYERSNWGSKGANPIIVNFISFSGHGVNYNGDTFLLIPGEQHEFLFINIDEWGRKFARVKDSVNIFFFDGCREFTESQSLIENIKADPLCKKTKYISQPGLSIMLFAVGQGERAEQRLDQQNSEGTKKLLGVLRNIKQMKEEKDWTCDNLIKQGNYVANNYYNISSSQQTNRPIVVFTSPDNFPSAARIQQNYEIAQIQEKEQKDNEEFKRVRDLVRVARREIQPGKSLIYVDKVNCKFQNMDIHEHTLYECRPKDDEEEWACEGFILGGECYGNVSIEYSKNTNYYTCDDKYCPFKMCKSCLGIYSGQKQYNDIVSYERPKNQLLFVQESLMKQNFNKFDITTHKWQVRALTKRDEKIKLYYPRIIAIDSKYIYSISGGLSKNLQDTSLDLTDHSIFAIDFDLRAMVDQMKMEIYRNHCAVGLFRKDRIYFAGGELQGQWLTTFNYFDIRTKKQERLPDIPVALFGPTMSVIQDKQGKAVVYLVGQSIKLGQLCIFKYTEKENSWSEYDLKMTDHPFGYVGCFVIDCYLVLVGGINSSFSSKSSSVIVIEIDINDQFDLTQTVTFGKLFQRNQASEDQYCPCEDYFYDNQAIESSKTSFYILGAKNVYFVLIDQVQDDQQEKLMSDYNINTIGYSVGIGSANEKFIQKAQIIP